MTDPSPSLSSIWARRVLVVGQLWALALAIAHAAGCFAPVPMTPAQAADMRQILAAESEPLKK